MLQYAHAKPSSTSILLLLECEPYIGVCYPLYYCLDNQCIILK